MAAEAAAEAARALAALEIQASVLAVAQSRHAGLCGRQRSFAATAFPHRARTHTHTHTHGAWTPPARPRHRALSRHSTAARPPAAGVAGARPAPRHHRQAARQGAAGACCGRSPFLHPQTRRASVSFCGVAPKIHGPSQKGPLQGGERPPLPHFPLDLDRCPCCVQVPVPSQLIGLMPPAPEAGGWPVDFELAKMGAPTTASRRTDGSRLSTTLSATRPVGAAA